MKLASCLIYAWAVPVHPLPVATSMKWAVTNQLSGRGKAATWQLIGHYLLLVLIWVHSFIEPDLFENNVSFDNTTPIYLINLLRKLGLGLGLDSELHYFNILHGEWRKRAPYLL